ncbi:hypothetical protein [Paenibacillus daejeonensis]|uniref:hypothetical protein n=1 Tax=Paenibacillus daejeonensis TaxID=135193 RepID=UPI0003770F88|nr:hypothetical protein [Paenibacillus daejeonensis]
MNKRKLKFGAAILLMSVMLAACGQNEAPAGESSGAGNTPTNPPVNQEEPPADNGNEAPNEATDPVDDTNGEEPDWGDEGMPPTALESATTVLRALKSGNMETVANWAHKDKGVRFSPHGTVNVETDQNIDADELAGLMSDDETRVWSSAGDGQDAIEMTYAEYHEQYVYDKDYEAVEPTENETQADSIGNLLEVYPADEYSYVEYYAADGSSLIRLVFEKIGPDHALAAIIHDQQS